MSDTPSSSAQPSSGSSGPSREPTEDLSRPADPGAPQIRAEGTVTEGVEPGCLLLASAGTLYLLLGVRPEVGTKVEVVGTIARGTLTTCQQGLPLQVEHLIER